MKKTFTLIYTVATLLMFASMSFGQTEAPNLGTTASFALFTGNGALSNNGPSMITGDIGTNVGAISGFGSATITGATREAGSAQSMQAAADVNILYNSLAAASCSTPSIAPELGGQTLVSTRTAGSSGVFCQTSPTPTSLNGTLTLSGDGIFIIKLNSALTTAANSQIVLTNGATANNVFFQINGAATLGAASTFQGTIVSLGAIVLGAQASVMGRLLSTTGAITLDNNVINNVAAPLITPFCGSPSNTTGIGQPLVVTGVTDQNCQTGTFRVLTTGGTGQAIDFSIIVGLSNADPFNCVRQVDNGEQLVAINNPNSTITPFEVNGLQSGLMTNTFLFDFKAFCTGQTTTPPSSTTTAPPSSTTTASCGSPIETLGQPLVITGVTDQNCQTGTFRILTTGGNGQPIDFANNVGLSNVDPFNCVRMVDNSDMVRAINNPNSDIAPFPLRGRQVGGSTSTTFSFNFKQFCTGVARVAGAESVSELEVTVLGNPTLGETVEIVVANTANERVTLQVSNPQGQPLGQLSSESTGNTVRERVRLGSSAGMYLLRVTTPTRIKTVKIVRQ